METLGKTWIARLISRRCRLPSAPELRRCRFPPEASTGSWGRGPRASGSAAAASARPSCRRWPATWRTGRTGGGLFFFFRQKKAGWAEWGLSKNFGVVLFYFTPIYFGCPMESSQNKALGRLVNQPVGLVGSQKEQPIERDARKSVFFCSFGRLREPNQKEWLSQKSPEMSRGSRHCGFHLNHLEQWFYVWSPQPIPCLKVRTLIRPRVPSRPGDWLLRQNHVPADLSVSNPESGGSGIYPWGVQGWSVPLEASAAF